MRRYTLEIHDRQYVIDVQELAADSFEVVVGNETYTVTLTGDEDLPEAPITPELRQAGAPADGSAGVGGMVKPPSPSVSTRSNRRAATPASVAVTRKPVAGGTASLNAPMPGVIIEIDVKRGDTVRRGQLVAILDAMKMHNHIRSPRAGTIREVCVDAGQAVGHGDPIVRFEEG